LAGTKNLNAWVCLAVIILAALILFLTRNSMAQSRFKQEFFRFLVGQETYLRTGSWEEVISDHYRIKYTEVDQAYVPLVADSAEEAYKSVSEILGQEPGRMTTIVIYPDSRSLASSFGWDKNEKALGVYWGGTIRVLSPRNWLNGTEDKERFVREGPMVHEFTHLMVDEMTRGNYNRWWTEGIAQYLERKITGFEFADPSPNKRRNYYSLENMEKNFDKLDQSVAYWESLQVVDFIVSHYGEKSLFSILNNLSQGDSMTMAAEKALGTDYRSFSSEFYQYLENN
jgi:hypothetical protein